MADKVMRIEGMTCTHCEQTVTEALTAAGALNVVADWRVGRAQFDGAAVSEGQLSAGVEAVELGLYGLGMGTVLTLLALTAALLKQTAMPRVRRLSSLVEPVSAVLLLLTGAYVVFYWLSPGGVLASIEALGGHG